jgi:hypothetical protein
MIIMTIHRDSFFAEEEEAKACVIFECFDYLTGQLSEF